MSNITPILDQGQSRRWQCMGSLVTLTASRNSGSDQKFVDSMIVSDTIMITIIDGCTL